MSSFEENKILGLTLSLLNDLGRSGGHLDSAFVAQMAVGKVIINLFMTE